MHVVVGVLMAYLKFGGIYLFYFFARLYASDLALAKMPKPKKVFSYLGCVAVVAFIAVVASCNFAGSSEDSTLRVASNDYTRGAIVFCVLLISGLIGLEDGKRRVKTEQTNRTN